MGDKNSKPDINIPPAPDPSKLYQKGVNVYLNNLDKFLNREMLSRQTFDPARILQQQYLQGLFGPTQYGQQLDALKILDPTGYFGRQQLGNTVFGNLANGGVDPQQSKLYGQFMSNVSKELGQGTKLTPEESTQIEQQVRRSQAARGNTYGQAPVQAEAFTKGMAGQQLYQQRLNNAFNAYSQAAPEQQAITNAGSFLNSPTPEQWLSTVSPVSPDRSMAYVNPNAGFQGQQFGLQNYQNQIAAAGLNQGGGGNPWMSALGSIASIVGPILGGIAFSDARAKNIFGKVGSKNGIGLYKFAYKHAPDKPMIGAIAQDVERTRPDAVVHDAATGLKKVNYGKLGMEAPMPAPAATGDTVPAMLKPGEVVLNKGQQAKVGASRIFKAIGSRHGKALGGGTRGYSGGGQVWNNPNHDIAYNNELEPPEFPPANMGIDPSEIIAPPGGGSPTDPSGYTPYPASGYTPQPSGGIPLVQPPNVNIPPNEQPPPAWMKWMPPIVKAGYTGFRAGQRLMDMYKNWRDSHQNNQGGGTPSGGTVTPGGGFNPFGGLPEGFTEGNRFGGGAPTFQGPGFTGPTWQPGGSIFGQLPGVRGGPLAGSFDGLGSGGGGQVGGGIGNAFANTLLRHLIKFGTDANGYFDPKKQFARNLLIKNGITSLSGGNQGNFTGRSLKSGG